RCDPSTLRLSHGGCGACQGQTALTEDDESVDLFVLVCQWFGAGPPCGAPPHTAMAVLLGTAEVGHRPAQSAQAVHRTQGRILVFLKRAAHRVELTDEDRK